MGFELTKEFCYLIGLLQTDGHHSAASRQRGKITLELSYRDIDILEKIQKILPVYSSITKRTRATNFAEETTSCTLAFFDLDIRKFLLTYIPCGKKSDIVKPANLPYELSYVRGLIDGNGSLGFTASGTPFISITIISEELAVFYLEFLHRHLGVIKSAKPNKRDNVYNIMVLNEDANNLARLLYLDAEIAINRKANLARKIRCWVRPENKKKASPKKAWTPEEDLIIHTKTDIESALLLGRSVNSISTRRWRLLRNSNKGK